MTQTAERTRPAATGPGGMHTGRAILVVAVVVLVGWLVLHHATTPATHAGNTATTAAAQPAVTTPGPTPPTTVALVAPASIKLQVLNGMLTGSLSGQWSAKLKANPGYQTLPPLNATARVAQSMIYVVTPGFQREANALAVAVGLPVTAVVTTTPPPASAPIPSSVASTANLVLVIGPDLAGSA
jgi:hypothetical protein